MRSPTISVVGLEKRKREPEQEERYYAIVKASNTLPQLNPKGPFSYHFPGEPMNAYPRLPQQTSFNTGSGIGQTTGHNAGKDKRPSDVNVEDSTDEMERLTAAHKREFARKFGVQGS